MSASSAKKCEPPCGACVPGIFFNTSPNTVHHTTHSEPQLLVTTNSLSVGIANTGRFFSLRRCLTATANFFFFFPYTSRWRASSVCSWISVCVVCPERHRAIVEVARCCVSQFRLPSLREIRDRCAARKQSYSCFFFLHTVCSKAYACFVM